MNGYLLDTVTVSEGSRPRANAGLAAWLRSVNESDTYLSVVTVGEIKQGIALLEPGTDRRNSLERWLAFDLIARFGRRVLSFDVEAAQLWGTLIASARERGALLAIVDSQIAAIAALHQLTVVTRNERHFTQSGVPTLNPWS